MSPAQPSTRTADLALAAEIAGNAGQIAMAHFRAGTTGWNKADGSPVSEADLAVNAYLKGVIAAARPDDGWLSEETADSEDRLSRRRSG